MITDQRGYSQLHVLCFTDYDMAGGHHEGSCADSQRQPTACLCNVNNDDRDDDASEGIHKAKRHER